MVSVEGIKALSAFDNLSDRLEMAARLTSGNIVEIGGGEGVNTLRFLKIAKEREGIVVVVDPFEQIEGADESYFKPYTKDKFLKTVEAYAAEMVLMECPSQDDSVKAELIWFKPIGFMFIDGLQDFNSVCNDLNLADSLEPEIICVDDYDRLTDSSQVPFAVKTFMLVNRRYDFVHNEQREAYLVKCE